MIDNIFSITRSDDNSLDKFVNKPINLSKNILIEIKRNYYIKNPLIIDGYIESGVKSKIPLPCPKCGDDIKLKYKFEIDEKEIWICSGCYKNALKLRNRLNKFKKL